MGRWIYHLTKKWHLVDGSYSDERENPYAAPGSRVQSFPDDGIDRLIAWQRTILICIGVYLAAVVLQFFVPAWRDQLVWCVCADILLAVVAVMGLSIEVFGVRRGTLLGLLTLTPLVGLFLLVVTYRKASAIVRRRQEQRTTSPPGGGCD